MSKITKESRIKEVYRTPVGHDVVDKIYLALGAKQNALTKGLSGNIKLSALPKLTKGLVSDEMLDSLIRLINSEKSVPVHGLGKVKKAWWKEAVFYQIYPRSFYDSDNDGIGDIKGITAKLDYLKELGVDALWLSPVYDSPNDDNGYDIRDYRKIMQEFGTMEDFDELLEGVHSRGMKIIMDLVVNHTSDEHEWFQKALSGDEDYHDYYIFRKGTEDEMPNNWLSFFAGPAWNYYPQLEEWGLHLFSRKQMDLNWDNPKVREEVADLVNWWLDKGVDGFRMDVINAVSKTEGLPDGDETIGAMVGIRGIENYFYGPHLHEYLRELREKAFEPHNAFSVGETPGLGMQMAKLITGEERKELDMIFSFDHLETPGHTRMEDYEYDLNYFRDYMIKWMEGYGNNCWMSIFYNNHDNPRMVSKVAKGTKYHQDIQKLLAVMQFTLKGTPFVFQGDEMGIANYVFSSMDEITDIESRQFFEASFGDLSYEEAFGIIQAGTREHARMLLPWNSDTTNRPYIVRQQTIDEEITDTYKKLIALRKGNDSLIYGDFELISKAHDRFVYRRKGQQEYIIDCNLGAKSRKAYNARGFEPVFLSQGNEGGSGKMPRNMSVLQPYEARIYLKK